MTIKPIYYLLFVAVLFACEAASQFEFTRKPTIISNPNPAVPLAAYLDFESEHAFNEILIHLSTAGGQEAEREITYKADQRHEQGFPLLMVHPDQTYLITFEISVDGKRMPFADTLTWRTTALPEDPAEFPRITVSVSEGDQMAPGYTLMNPRRRIPINIEGANEKNQSFGMLLAVDKDGEVVWYYRNDSRISDFDLLQDGNISFMTQDSRLHVIDWMGNTQKVWYAADRPEGPDDEATPVAALTFHHDASFKADGNVVVLSSEYRSLPDYFTSETDPKAPRKEQEVMGDIIKEFTPEGEVVWEWNTFDYLDPYRIGYETFSQYWERRGFPGVIDWSHANTILYDQGDDAFIINFRYQSAIMKIDRETKNIKWIFGEPSGWTAELQSKLIKLEGDDWFWHQHSPVFNEGKVLLFNNDNYQARPFDSTVPIENTNSHIAEYQLDELNKTAELIWSTEDHSEEKIVSIAMGDVDYLPNGNVLAAYGALIDTRSLNSGEVDWYNRGRFPQWTMVREYQHSEPARIVWELRLTSRDENSKVGWTIFGAERFDK